MWNSISIKTSLRRWQNPVNWVYIDLNFQLIQLFSKAQRYTMSSAFKYNVICWSLVVGWIAYQFLCFHIHTYIYIYIYIHTFTFWSGNSEDHIRYLFSEVWQYVHCDGKFKANLHRTDKCHQCVTPISICWCWSGFVFTQVNMFSLSVSIGAVWTWQ